MNPWSSLLEKFAALFGGMFNATALDLDTVVLQGFNALEQGGRNARTAHLSEAFDLWDTEDGHDARNDGDRDSNFATTLDEPKVSVILEKKLRDQKLGARVNLPLEIVQVKVGVWTLRVFFRIRCASDT